MERTPNRYKEMERYMTIGLCSDTLIFFFYLLAAGNGVIWLKILLSLFGFGLSGLILWVLYTSHELTRQRSLWITTGAAAIAVCLLFSLILNFPSPNKYKQVEEKTSCAIVQQI